MSTVGIVKRKSVKAGKTSTSDRDWTDCNRGGQDPQEA